MRNQKENFVEVEFRDDIYTLTQLPHIDGRDDDVFYSGTAVDEDGNYYYIAWEVKEGYEKMEDESDHCDWSKPCTVELML